MTALKLGSLLVILCVITAAGQNASPLTTVAPQETTAGHPLSNQPQTSKTAKPDPTADSQDEPIDEDSAPAALQLDVSNVPPLIKELYQATRETKEPAILARLEQAKKILDGGADVKAIDAQGRTALHWTIFGSSYNTKGTIVVAYEEIADDLIQRGVDINREDVYQDTALDYLLYSPNFEMQTLLIEHGASSGFLSAFYHFFDDRPEGVPATYQSAIMLSRKGDLTPGQTMSIRLDVPVTATARAPAIPSLPP